MSPEDLVFNHRERPHRGGRKKFWIKVKNRSHPAMEREL
jgi:bifunctional non-homologous end joining protein LigD